MEIAAWGWSFSLLPLSFSFSVGHFFFFLGSLQVRRPEFGYLYYFSGKRKEKKERNNGRRKSRVETQILLAYLTTPSIYSFVSLRVRGKMYFSSLLPGRRKLSWGCVESESQAG